MPLTRAEIINLYDVLLNRIPSEEEIQSHLNGGATTTTFVEAATPEIRSNLQYYNNRVLSLLNTVFTKDEAITSLGKQLSDQHSIITTLQEKLSSAVAPTPAVTVQPLPVIVNNDKIDEIPPIIKLIRSIFAKIFK